MGWLYYCEYKNNFSSQYLVFICCCWFVGAVKKYCSRFLSLHLKENINWFWWAKLQVTAFIYLLFIATRRKRKHLMTQGSIYTTKLILVKNIYIYSMFSSRILPIYAVFQPFLLLFATVHYNLQSTDYWLLTSDCKQLHCNHRRK